MSGSLENAGYSSNIIFIVIVLVIILIALWIYSSHKNKGCNSAIPSMEGMDMMGEGQSNREKEGGNPNMPTTPYIGKPTNVPSDLLPYDNNSQWSTLNPTMNPSNVLIPDLLQPGYHIGIDTVGQSLKNANMQLRSDPVIQKQQVGPWSQSTIEGDSMRPNFEIGK